MILSVYICEDDIKHRKRMEKIVNDYIALHDYDIKIVMSTGNPTELLEYVEQNPDKQALYILDVDLQHEMNGIVLASKIRASDAYGKIIFVTTHAQLSYLTFRYRVEAMDYIIKGNDKDIEKDVQECIEAVYTLHLNDKPPEKRGYQVTVGKRVELIPFDEIMFFESCTSTLGKIILHTKTRRIEIYSSLKSVENISPDFFRCHQSFVVNMKNIKSVDKQKKIAAMSDGATVFVAVRKLSEFLKRIGK